MPSPLPLRMLRLLLALLLLQLQLPAWAPDPAPAAGPTATGGIGIGSARRLQRTITDVRVSNTDHILEQGCVDDPEHFLDLYGLACSQHTTESTRADCEGRGSGFVWEEDEDHPGKDLCKNYVRTSPTANGPLPQHDFTGCFNGSDAGLDDRT